MSHVLKLKKQPEGQDSHGAWVLPIYGNQCAPPPLASFYLGRLLMYSLWRKVPMFPKFCASANFFSFKKWCNLTIYRWNIFNKLQPYSHVGSRSTKGDAPLFNSF